MVRHGMVCLWEFNSPKTHHEVSMAPKAAKIRISKTTVDDLEIPEVGEVTHWDETLDGFGVRVRPSGRKMYIARYTAPSGRQRWITIGRHGSMTAKDARDIARTKLNAARGGADPAKERDAARAQKTLAEAIQRYLDEDLDQLSPTHRETRRLQLEWWSRELGRLPLSEVTKSEIVAARDRLARTPVTWGEGDNQISKPRSPSTVNRYVAALAAVMRRAAYQWELIPETPMRGLRRAKEPRGRMRVLEPEQMNALLDACAKDMQKLLHPFVLVAVHTGARRGELLGLTWSDVDLTRGFVTFRDTKNSETRSVPVVGRAAEALRELSKVRTLGDDRVFPLSKGRLRGGWERATEAAGLDGLVIHELRHVAASWLVQSGVPLRTVAEILGQKTLAMVMRYSHMAPDHLKESMDRIAEKLG